MNTLLQPFIGLCGSQKHPSSTLYVLTVNACIRFVRCSSFPRHATEREPGGPFRGGVDFVALFVHRVVGIKVLRYVWS